MRNPDEPLRDLERQAVAAGDPLLAFRAFAELRRRGGVPDAGKWPEVRLETPSGLLSMTLTSATHISVLNHDNSGPDQFRSPWVFNRVPILFHAHYNLTPEGWIPSSDRKRQDRPVSYEDILQAPTYWGSFYVSRADRPYEVNSTISAQALRRLVQTLTPIVQEWAARSAATVGAAGLHDLLSKLGNLETEYGATLGKLAELEAQIGSFYLDYLRSRGP